MYHPPSGYDPDMYAQAPPLPQGLDPQQQQAPQPQYHQHHLPHHAIPIAPAPAPMGQPQQYQQHQEYRDMYTPVPSQQDPRQYDPMAQQQQSQQQQPQPLHHPGAPQPQPPALPVVESHNAGDDASVYHHHQQQPSQQQYAPPQTPIVPSAPVQLSAGATLSQYNPNGSAPIVYQRIDGTVPGAPAQFINSGGAPRMPPYPVDVVAINLAPVKKARVSQACLNCRRRKIRCGGGFPCEHCHAFGLNCAYGIPAKRGPKAVPGTSSAASSTTSLDSLASSASHTAPSTPDLSRAYADQTPPPQRPFQPATGMQAGLGPSPHKSTPQDIDDIASNLTLMVTLDEEGNARGFSNYGNSSGYHLLRGLPANSDVEGINVFISQLAQQRMHAIEVDQQHRFWFPPAPLAHLLVDVYFNTIHHWLPMLHRPRIEAYLRPILDRTSPQPPYDAYFLLYALMSLAALQWERQHHILPATVPLSRLLVAHAKRLLPSMFETPVGRIESVQACLLLAAHDNGQAAGNTWLLDGMAARMAVALGLHLDPRAVQVDSPIEAPRSVNGHNEEEVPPTPTHLAHPAMQQQQQQQAEPGREFSPSYRDNRSPPAHALVAHVAPGIPTRLITWSIVVTLDRLSAAANGRPVQLHEDDCDLDLADLTATPENRARYPDDQAMLLPESSYWPHYARWVVIAGRVLRAVNSFRYRRSHLPSTLLPELHAALTEFRAAIPPHLEFNPAQFAPGVEPSVRALESAVLMMGYYQCIVYLYRPLVSMVIAGVLTNQVCVDPGTPRRTPASARAGDLMKARPYLIERMRSSTESASAANGSDTPMAASDANGNEALASAAARIRLPPLYAQYISILEMAVQSIVHIFVAISPRQHQFFTVMLHQLGSVIAAARVVVAGGGNAALIRDCLRELPAVLARLTPHAALAVHTYSMAVSQLAEIEAVLARENGGNATSPTEGTTLPTTFHLPAHIHPDEVSEAYHARRHAQQAAAVVELLHDPGRYAREMHTLADAYLACRGNTQPLAGRVVTVGGSAAPVEPPQAGVCQHPQLKRRSISEPSDSPVLTRDPAAAPQAADAGAGQAPNEMPAAPQKTERGEDVPPSMSAATPAAVPLPAFPDNLGEWALEVLPEGFDLHMS
ncbi:transcription factor [Blastocladiella emersonii ATCC 22665]|nr:transcription factor [Blastocladiella emersonii ATCC 22665]